MKKEDTTRPLRGDPFAFFLRHFLYLVVFFESSNLHTSSAPTLALNDRLLAVSALTLLSPQSVNGSLAGFFVFR
jgi:hypothetical protein